MKINFFTKRFILYLILFLFLFFVPIIVFKSISIGEYHFAKFLRIPSMSGASLYIFGFWIGFLTSVPLVIELTVFFNHRIKERTKRFENLKILAKQEKNLNKRIKKSKKNF